MASDDDNDDFPPLQSPVFRQTDLMILAEGLHEKSLQNVKFIVESSYSEVEVGLSLTDRWGNTALHYAARNFEMSPPDVQARKREIFNFLAANGADPLFPNKEGQTPLSLAPTIILQP